MPHLRLAATPVLALSSLLAALPLVGGCGGSTSSTKGTPEHDAGVDSYFVLPGWDAGDDAGSTKHDSGSADAKKPTGDAGVDAAPVDAGVDSYVLPIALPLYVCEPLAYTTPVTIGGTQTFQMIVDTGSATMGVASSSCTDCNVLPYYTPGPTAVDQDITAANSFGRGYWQGEVYQDNVNMGASPAAPVEFIAVTEAQELFVAGGCSSASGGNQGLIGFSPPGALVYGTTNFFTDLVAATGMPSVFATELCDNGGTLWLGGYDPAAIAGGATPRRVCGSITRSGSPAAVSTRVGGTPGPGFAFFVWTRSTRSKMRVAKGIRPARMMATQSGSIFIQATL